MMLVLSPLLLRVCVVWVHICVTRDPSVGGTEEGGGREGRRERRKGEMEGGRERNKDKQGSKRGRKRGRKGGQERWRVTERKGE